jgi:hypothetical protein
MIKLPPLPGHPDPHTYQWTELERIIMRVMQIAAARTALEAAAEVCDAGATNCASAIRAIKIEGETP